MSQEKNLLLNVLECLQSATLQEVQLPERGESISTH